jgi:hypothetical protein
MMQAITAQVVDFQAYRRLREASARSGAQATGQRFDPPLPLFWYPVWFVPMVLLPG